MSWGSAYLPPALQPPPPTPRRTHRRLTAPLIHPRGGRKRDHGIATGAPPGGALRGSCLVAHRALMARLLLRELVGQKQSSGVRARRHG
jgi:hypothetical protein